MLIDVHSHYSPQAYMDIMDRTMGLHRGTGWFKYPHTDSETDIAGRIRIMDEAGVQMQVLSTGIMAPYCEKPSDGAEAAKVTNDGYAALTHRYPDRFASFINLPLPHIDASLKEIERGYDQLGMVGVAMNCAVFKQSVADPEFEPLYAEMNRRHSIIYYHPCGTNISSPMVTDYNIGGVGAVLEDTILSLHLIAKQIPNRYPNIRIIISHLGGMMPVFLGRLDHQFAIKDLAEEPSATAKRFFYDTVGHGSKAALLAAYTAFGAEQLVPGSDWPVLLAAEPYKQTFDHVAEAGLPTDAVDKILQKNAPKLFGLPA